MKKKESKCLFKIVGSQIGLSETGQAVASKLSNREKFLTWIKLAVQNHGGFISGKGKAKKSNNEDTESDGENVEKSDSADSAEANLNEEALFEAIEKDEEKNQTKRKETDSKNPSKTNSGSGEKNTKVERKREKNNDSIRSDETTITINLDEKDEQIEVRRKEKKERRRKKKEKNEKKRKKAEKKRKRSDQDQSGNENESKNTTESADENGNDAKVSKDKDDNEGSSKRRRLNESSTAAEPTSSSSNSSSSGTLRNNTFKLLKERSVPAWELSNTAWLEGVPRTWPDDAARKRLIEAFTNTFHISVVSLTKDFSSDLWVVNLASPEVTKQIVGQKLVVATNRKQVGSSNRKEYIIKIIGLVNTM